MFEISKEINLDLQELFEGMSNENRTYFVNNNVSSATDDALIQELINRGYEIVKG